MWPVKAACLVAWCRDGNKQEQSAQYNGLPWWAPSTPAAIAVAIAAANAQ